MKQFLTTLMLVCAFALPATPPARADTTTDGVANALAAFYAENLAPLETKQAELQQAFDAKDDQKFLQVSDEMHTLYTTASAFLYRLDEIFDDADRARLAQAISLAQSQQSGPYDLSATSLALARQQLRAVDSQCDKLRLAF